VVWIVGWKNSMNSAAIHIFIFWKFVHPKDHPEAAVGKPAARMQIQAIREGAVEFLAKPVDHHLLLETVRAALDL
jgi:DNA-binding NtrC family response regulator